MSLTRHVRPLTERECRPEGPLLAAGMPSYPFDRGSALAGAMQLSRNHLAWRWIQKVSSVAIAMTFSGCARKTQAIPATKKAPRRVPGRALVFALL